MNNDKLLKMIFGIVVFLFSLTLAYFTASYLSKEIDKPLDFWLTIAMMGGLYVVAGILSAQIFSISLGFLFSADILILSALHNEFGNISEIYKVSLIGIIIAILYIVAFTSHGRATTDRVQPPPPHHPHPTPNQ